MDKNNFIYTMVPEVYDSLKLLGYKDMGVVTGGHTMYVVQNDKTRKVPDELKKLCLFTDRVFFVAGKEGGEKIE